MDIFLELMSDEKSKAYLKFNKFNQDQIVRKSYCRNTMYFIKIQKKYLTFIIFHFYSRLILWHECARSENQQSSGSQSLYASTAQAISEMSSRRDILALRETFLNGVSSTKFDIYIITLGTRRCGMNFIRLISSEYSRANNFLI